MYSNGEPAKLLTSYIVFAKVPGMKKFNDNAKPIRLISCADTNWIITIPNNQVRIKRMVYELNERIDYGLEELSLMISQDQLPVALAIVAALFPESTLDILRVSESYSKGSLFLQ